MAKIMGQLINKKRVGPLIFCKNHTVRIANGLLSRRRAKGKVEGRVTNVAKI